MASDTISEYFDKACDGILPNQLHGFLYKLSRCADVKPFGKHGHAVLSKLQQSKVSPEIVASTLYLQDDFSDNGMLVKVLSLNVWLMKLLVDYKYLQAFKQLQSVLKLLLLADVFFVHNIETKLFPPCEFMQKLLRILEKEQLYSLISLPHTAADSLFSVYITIITHHKLIRGSNIHTNISWFRQHPLIQVAFSCLCTLPIGIGWLDAFPKYLSRAPEILGGGNSTVSDIALVGSTGLRVFKDLLLNSTDKHTFIRLISQSEYFAKWILTNLITKEDWELEQNLVETILDTEKAALNASTRLPEPCIIDPFCKLCEELWNYWTKSQKFMKNPAYQRKCAKIIQVKQSLASASLQLVETIMAQRNAQKGKHSNDVVEILLAFLDSFGGYHAHMLHSVWLQLLLYADESQYDKLASRLSEGIIHDIAQLLCDWIALPTESSLGTRAADESQSKVQKLSNEANWSSIYAVAAAPLARTLLFLADKCHCTKSFITTFSNLCAVLKQTSFGDEDDSRIDRILSSCAAGTQILFGVQLSPTFVRSPRRQSFSSSPASPSEKYLASRASPAALPEKPHSDSATTEVAKSREIMLAYSAYFKENMFSERQKLIVLSLAQSQPTVGKLPAPANEVATLLVEQLITPIRRNIRKQYNVELSLKVCTGVFAILVTWLPYEPFYNALIQYKDPNVAEMSLPHAPSAILHCSIAIGTLNTSGNLRYDTCEALLYAVDAMMALTAEMIKHDAPTLPTRSFVLLASKAIVKLDADLTDAKDREQFGLRLLKLCSIVSYSLFLLHQQVSQSNVFEAENIPPSFLNQLARIDYSIYTFLETRAKPIRTLSLYCAIIHWCSIPKRESATVLRLIALSLSCENTTFLKDATLRPKLGAIINAALQNMSVCKAHLRTRLSSEAIEVTKSCIAILDSIKDDVSVAAFVNSFALFSELFSGDDHPNLSEWRMLVACSLAEVVTRCMLEPDMSDDDRQKIIDQCLQYNIIPILIDRCIPQGSLPSNLIAVSACVLALESLSNRDVRALKTVLDPGLELLRKLSMNQDLLGQLLEGAASKQLCSLVIKATGESWFLQCTTNHRWPPHFVHALLKALLAYHKPVPATLRLALELTRRLAGIEVFAWFISPHKLNVGQVLNSLLQKFPSISPSIRNEVASVADQCMRLVPR